LRVISGKYGGRSIKGKMPAGVRPTTDKSRESLFSTLDNYIYFEGKKVLDCYAGSGLVGIEFLSRGAEHCTFVEKNYQPITVIKQFASDIDLQKDSYSVIKSDVLAFLKKCETTYNIIFSDAPYHLQTANQIVSIVEENKLLEHEGFLILETEDKEEIVYSTNFTLVKQKSFGISKLTILEFANQ
jgi:16S rRNA (guanine(966)-N(2))-methyltransferase RsmD